MPNPPNPASRSSPQTPGKRSRVFKVKLSSQSKSDWLASSLTTAKLIAAGAECIPFPYVKGVFGTAIVILETVEKVKRNRDDLKELCGNIMDIIKIIQDQLLTHRDTDALKLKGLCEDLAGVLEGILKSIKQLSTESRGLSDRFKEVMKLGSTTNEIAGYRMRIQELRLNFVNLNNQHIFLLYGLGGAGKTQIALKFIEESSSWPQKYSNDKKFRDHSPGSPQCKHGNILITSRNPRLRAYAGSHSSVSDMEEPDAVALLLKSCAEEITPRNKELATDIVKALYYLPLAIIQAGAFILKSGALFSYLKLYSENQAQLLSEQPDQSHDDYAWTVYTTWQISFEQLSKPAATLLQLCSFLHHKGISEDIFSRASLYDFPSNGPSREELHDLLEFLTQFSGPTGVWKSLQFIEVMNEITAYSLANFDPDEKLYSIHPLVHNWSRSTLTDREQYQYWMVAIVGMSISGIPGQDLQPGSLKLLPHVDSLLCGNMDIRPDFRRKYGLLYYHAERVKDAEELELAVLEHQRSVMGEDNLDTLHAMEALASTYSQQVKYKEAEELEIVALEKRQKILGDDHPDTLHTMGNLVSTYLNLGKLKEAEELGLVVFEKQRKIMGEDHPHSLRTMENLASTYHNHSKFKEAEELDVVVLEKRRKILGEDHPHTLRTMANLASTYHSLGKLQEAEELKFVVLEKQKKILGEDHPDTLHDMQNLATTYYKLHKLQEAEELEVVALEKRRKILGDDHPHTLHTMGKLASTYYKLGKLKEAEQLYIERLDRRTSLLGPDHPDTLHIAHVLYAFQISSHTIFTPSAKFSIDSKTSVHEGGIPSPDTLWTMGNLASTYHDLGKLQEAEELKVVVLDTGGKDQGTQNLGLGALFSAPSVRSRGKYWERRIILTLCKLKKAEELKVVVLEKRRKILGENHPDTLWTMGSLASTYYNLGKLMEAEELEVVVLEKWRKILGENHPDSLHAMANLAITYHDLGKLKEAEQLYVELLDRQTTLLGPDHPDTLGTTDSLAETHKAMA
ncbi:hypothetical protein DFH09DRAFT_1505800 [Mycena vulgaris]|nr:hypothetical protein DFH09DRAFT_1505800 [Mycena vulgaris]